MASTEQEHMRPARGALSYLIVVALFTSCLQLEQTVTIHADGSGIQAMEMTIPERVIEALQQQASAHNPVRRVADVTAVFERRKVEKELAAIGLKLTTHKVAEVRRGRRATLAATFEKLEHLQKSPLGGSHADWVFTKGPVKGTIQLDYYPRGRAAWLNARKKVAELKKKPNDPILQSFFAKQEPQLRGLDVSVTINLPGTVLMAYGDLQETGLKQVRARVQGADIKTPRDLILALAPRYQVVFDGRGCKLPLAPARKPD
jgi:hypothetical protein